MWRVGNNCNGQCSEIYPAQDGHIKQREQDERFLGSKGQFCAAFYHVHEWGFEWGTREHYCRDETNCIISKRATSNDWRVQAKTVVAVVKFQDENGVILYEARYKNCVPKKKHAEDFFKEDIENQNGVLAGIVEANPKGTITMYLTLQPCNRSTETANTKPNQSCCDILQTIVGQRLRNNGRNINLCVKAANTRRLSLIEETGNNETLRQNAVAGITTLMQVEGVNVSGMTPEDWHYLLSLTNELQNRKDLEVHEDRQDLDGCVQSIFDQIQDEIDQDEIDQDEMDQDEIDQA
jgi:pyrimidine deaminase RibD-like protein